MDIPNIANASVDEEENGDSRTVQEIGDTGKEEPTIPVWSEEDIEASFTDHENFRMNPELHGRVNRVLQKFVGSHYYHNYTSGK